MINTQRLPRLFANVLDAVSDLTSKPVLAHSYKPFISNENMNVLLYAMRTAETREDRYYILVGATKQFRFSESQVKAAMNAL